jgi:hypothetical protein
MYQILDQFGTILGEYHNRKSAEMALQIEFLGVRGLTIRRNPNYL